MLNYSGQSHFCTCRYIYEAVKDKGGQVHFSPKICQSGVHIQSWRLSLFLSGANTTIAIALIKKIIIRQSGASAKCTIYMYYYVFAPLRGKTAKLDVFCT